MAKPNVISQNARERVIRYLVAAHIASELKNLDKEGNFSPHTAHNFLFNLGITVSIIMEKFSLEKHKARKIAQRIMLTYLVKGIPYPTDFHNELITDELVLSAFRPFPLYYSIDEVKQTCIFLIKRPVFKGDPIRSWEDIVQETERVTTTWLMNDDPYNIPANSLQALLCLYVSRFYGLIVGKQFERKESVRYFLEREVLDYITEEGLELDFVLTQRAKKRANKQ